MSNRLGHKKRVEKPKDPARSIPAGMKREVRQRCGFGCVICGLPIYEYEHMMEWSQVKRHVAEEITLLCSFHHDEKTKGLRHIDTILAANALPHNLKQSSSKPYMYAVQPANAQIIVGQNRFYLDEKSSLTYMVAVSIASMPIIWFNFQDGGLLLNLSLYDSRDRLVVGIRDNELIYAMNAWDITFIGTTLQIRSGSGKIVLSLNVSAKDRMISVDRAVLLFKGYEVTVDKNGLGTPYNGLGGNWIKGSGHLINFGEPTASALNLAGYRPADEERKIRSKKAPKIPR